MSKLSEEHLENIVNEKDPIKQAHLINYAYKEQFVSLHEVATILHKHPSYISHLMRVIKLPEYVLDGYYAKSISLAHLIVLSRLTTEEDIKTAYKEILSHNITSTHLESLIRELKYHVGETTELIPKKILDRIRTRFKKEYPNGSIQILQSKIKGKITIDLKGSGDTTTHQILELLERFAEDEDALKILE